MNKKIFLKIFYGMLFVGVILFAQGTNAFANPGHDRGHREIVVRHERGHHHDYFYRPLFSGLFRVVFGVPSHTTEVVVVAPPVVVQPRETSCCSVTINVPNSNGSYTPVTLVKQGDGYVGPQGEYYPNHPTVEQLKVLYGK